MQREVRLETSLSIEHRIGMPTARFKREDVIRRLALQPCARIGPGDAHKRVIVAPPQPKTTAHRLDLHRYRRIHAPDRRGHTLNDSPQPQVLEAFGFEKTNPFPFRPSL